MAPRSQTSPTGPASVTRAGGGLTRDRIVDAAIRLVDTEGLPALTMRRLAAALGVEAMSLYRYVGGREDLLEAVVDTLVDTIEIPAPGDLPPVDGWQAFLQVLAHDVRRLALEHPAAFPLIATRHPAAPWLRPPLRSLRIVEAFLEGLLARGFSDEQAVAAYRSFTSFLLGHLFLESATQGAMQEAATAPAGEPPSDDVHASLDARDLPALVRLRPQLAEDHTDEEFEAALEHLLVRLDLEVVP